LSIRQFVGKAVSGCKLSYNLNLKIKSERYNTNTTDLTLTKSNNKYT